MDPKRRRELEAEREKLLSKKPKSKNALRARNRRLQELRMLLDQRPLNCSLS